MTLSNLLRRQHPRKSDTDLSGGTQNGRELSRVPNEAARNSETTSRTDLSALSDQLLGVQQKNIGTSPRESTTVDSESREDVSSSDDRPSAPSAPADQPLLPVPRFSLRKFRNASDPQLSTTAKSHSVKKSNMGSPSVPAMPATPSIITTAPTSDTMERPTKRNKRLRMPGKLKSSLDSTTPGVASPLRTSISSRNQGSGNGLEPTRGSMTGSRVTFDEMLRPPAPPPYGEDGISPLAIPASRLSESSRSDGSLGEQVYASQTTTHISTTTTVFRLSRRAKKPPPSLFPLPIKITPTESTGNGRSSTGESTNSSNPSPNGIPPHAPLLDNAEGMQPGALSPTQSSAQLALAASSMNFAAPGSPMLRHDSSTSVHSTNSSPSLQPPARLGRRGRSSTMSSLSIRDDMTMPPPPTASGRTSTSTIGRSSLGGIFNLSHRLRQNSEPPFPRYGSPGNTGPATPGSCTSKSNSFQIIRESIVIPERDGDEPPSKYLVRLQEAVSRSVIASVLSKSTETFHKAVLRSYMRGFAFFENPMDMAIRKLLMEVELPKETQQIDRVLQGFADRYHECNPGIYISADQAYFIAFSLLILHTDVFNKNNKHKMQKQDYIKNTRGEGIAEDILECFYDNISYTPFIHVEDDLDHNGERLNPHRSRKILFPKGSVDPLKRAPREPVDPYTLILDNKLDILRPNLGDVMELEDPYSYLGTAESLNLQNLQDTFFKTAVLQIVSARSRPEAFMSPSTISNPEEASAGVVDIKITRVGILWRKDPKKKKARSPWQEWGAILTGTQLYFFRNTAWTKNLMHQYDAHLKQGNAGMPCIFKPPLESFKPDALMPTDDAVALRDSSYKKHKNAFIFVRHGGFEETFLADSEGDVNDWLAKLNYASAFRTAGVRMRGVVGGHYEGQRTRAIRRMESSNSTKSVQTPTGEVTIQSGKIDTQLAQQILAARRQIMVQKISEADEKLATARKELDGQLRSARHLQILAPVQAKSREQVILAAGRMAAKLKWVRMEIWRMQCHRDILSLDLAEEADPGSTSPHPKKKLPSQAAPSSPHSVSSAGLKRLDSRMSVAPSQKSHRSSATRSREYGMNDIFQSPPELSRQSSFQRAQPTWELPPLTFDPQISSAQGVVGKVPQSPSLASLAHQESIVGSRDGNADVSVAGSSQLPTRHPSVDDGEIELLKETGLVSPGVLAANHNKPLEPARLSETPSELKDKRWSAQRESDLPERTASDRSKVRRSLHRTLREAHVQTHHRGKRGKDSSSSAGLADDGSSTHETEGLARGTGSFTVHGKKASVITFGSEWQSMSPEERIRLRKQAHGEDTKLLVPTAIEDESESAAESTATESIVTARSAAGADANTRSADLQISEGQNSDFASVSEGTTPFETPQAEMENRQLGGEPSKEFEDVADQEKKAMGEIGEETLHPTSIPETLAA